MSQSQSGKAAATRRTARTSIATPRLKFADHNTGIVCAARSIAARCSSRRPVLPLTKATRREPKRLTDSSDLRDAFEFADDGHVIARDLTNDAKDGAELPARSMHVETSSNQERNDALDRRVRGIGLHYDDHDGTAEPIKGRLFLLARTAVEERAALWPLSRRNAMVSG